MPENFHTPSLGRFFYYFNSTPGNFHLASYFPLKFFGFWKPLPFGISINLPWVVMVIYWNCTLWHHYQITSILFKVIKTCLKVKVGWCNLTLPQKATALFSLCSFYLIKGYVRPNCSFLKSAILLSIYKTGNLTS